jgi:ubiquitin C-terminal hydrolase
MAAATAEPEEKPPAANGGTGVTLVNGSSATPKLLTVYPTHDDFKLVCNKKLENFDAWYLVESKWYAQCLKYLGYESMPSPSSAAEKLDPTQHPGPIDLSPLLDPERAEDRPDQIKKHLVEEMDYSLVPEELWNGLVEDFGLLEGQAPVKRIARETGLFLKQVRIETYLTSFNLCLQSDMDTFVDRQFSKADNLDAMVAEMRKVFKIPVNKETRLWGIYSGTTFEKFTETNKSIQESGLYPLQKMMLEVKNEDGTWPRGEKDTPKIASSSTSNSMKITSSSPIPLPPPSNSIEKKDEEKNGKAWKDVDEWVSNTSKFSNSGEPSMVEESKPGICGLSNLGNTCFMNSIIQGLSNIPAIAEYFENDNYEEDVNEENPMGMKGEIARAFGQLIKDMWSCKYKHVVPRNFKMVVGRFAPQFSGYQQQDSQELLTFLLWGLHEDLNRIKKKPYIERSDVEGRDEVDIAKEEWENHKKRNDSVILDIFHGLLKSTLVCPECSKVSVTFDPMCYLCLPLPVKKERQIEFTFMSLSPGVPTQYKVTCSKIGTIGDFLAAAGKVVNVPATRLVATDVFHSRFHKIYTPGEALEKTIQDKDEVYVYETADIQDNKQVVVPVYLRVKKTGSQYSPSQLFSHPFLLSTPPTTSEEELYTVLLNHMSRYVTRPSPEEQWWKTPQRQQQKPQQPPQPPPSWNNTNSGGGAGEKMETNSDSPQDSTSGGSEVQSPAAGSEESPVFDNSNNPLSLQDDDMNSDEEEPPKGNRIFNINLVNSYGNSTLSQPGEDDDGIMNLESKNYIGLDWHPRAKQLFFKEKIASQVNQDESVNSTDAPKKQVVSLQECIELYTSQEKLSEDDKWYCPRCKLHQQATKKLNIWMLPEVLIISLKRFTYNRYWRDKIDHMVQFPIEGLDMSPYVIAPGHGKAIYDLTTVSNHYGGMGGGHYTAYGKNKLDGKWYHFDDSSVTEAKQSEIVTKAAYVLFYHRRDTNSPAKPASASSIAHMTNVAAAAAEPTANGAAPPLSVATAVNGNMVNGNGVASVSSDEDMDMN